MMDYIYDETIYPRFDHVDIVDSMPGDPETAYIVKCRAVDRKQEAAGLVAAGERVRHAVTPPGSGG